jgi:hypothetical protein
MDLGWRGCRWRSACWWRACGPTARRARPSDQATASPGWWQEIRCSLQGRWSPRPGPEGCWRDPRDGGIWAERPENVRACTDTAERFSLGGTLATVGFTAGGVLAVASMALWLAVPSQRGERRAALRCGTGPGDLGLSCAVGF